MAKSKMTVKVYMDFINYLGDVTESCLLAEFVNMDWAKDFIEKSKRYNDSTTRIRVEVK